MIDFSLIFSLYNIISKMGYKDIALFINLVVNLVFFNKSFRLQNYFLFLFVTSYLHNVQKETQ